MSQPTDASQVFNRLRPRLQRIAYRVLGSTTEAEDVVEGAWLRWREAAHHVPDRAESWLVVVTARLAIERAQAGAIRGRQCDSPWLPAPLFGDLPASPDQIQENVENVSIAFLTLLEQLPPAARAAYLMREVFGADFGEVAATLGSGEPTCRQLVHHARFQMLEQHARFAMAPRAHLRLLREFAAASERGDMAMLNAMLSEDAELIGYDCRRAPGTGRPLRGGRRIARLYFATRSRYGNLLRTRLTPVHGEWALLRFIDGVLESIQTLDTDGARILRIRAQRDPEQLVRWSSMLISP